MKITRVIFLLVGLLLAFAGALYDWEPVTITGSALVAFGIMLPVLFQTRKK